jgi:hypothetical protein
MATYSPMNLKFVGYVLGLLFAAGRVVASVSPQAPSEPPSELVRAPCGVGSGTPCFSNPTRVVNYWFSTLSQQVTIKCKTRPTPSTLPWTHAQVFLSTAYYVTAMDALCDRDFFVAGVHKDGQFVIERWTFGGDPCAVRERRTVLLQNYTLGHVRCMTADREARFLLILVHEGSKLYKMDLSSGSLTLLYDQTTLGALSTMAEIIPVSHTTEGRKYQMSPLSAGAHGTGDFYPVVFLPDANNDGVLETAVVVASDSQWNALGYNQAVWTDLRACH